MRIKFWSEDLKGRNCLEDINVDGRITLNNQEIFRGCELDSSQNKGQCWTLVNTVLSFHFVKMRGSY